MGGLIQTADKGKVGGLFNARKQKKKAREKGSHVEHIKEKKHAEAIMMLQKNHEKQQSAELVIIEQMIPQDHLLRRIDQSIDFSFIRRFAHPCTSLDATTLSVNRKRRFRDNHIPEQICNEILRQAMAKGLVGGAILYTDSTHVKAKANKHKKQTVTVERTPRPIWRNWTPLLQRSGSRWGRSLLTETTTAIQKKPPRGTTQKRP